MLFKRGEKCSLGLERLKANQEEDQNLLDSLTLSWWMGRSTKVSATDSPSQREYLFLRGVRSSVSPANTEDGSTPWGRSVKIHLPEPTMGESMRRKQYRPRSDQGICCPSCLSNDFKPLLDRGWELKWFWCHECHRTWLVARRIDDIVDPQQRI